MIICSDPVLDTQMDLSVIQVVVTCGGDNILSHPLLDLTLHTEVDGMVIAMDVHLPHLRMDPAMAHLEAVEPLLLIMVHPKEVAHHQNIMDLHILHLEVLLLPLWERHHLEVAFSSSLSLTRRITLCSNLMINTPCGATEC